METTQEPPATSSSHHALRSAHESGMESSIFRFKDVNFVVSSKEKGVKKDKYILEGVSGTVKWGHVLAIMGPSGAGKTVLISALTLDAFFGKAYGSVTLNGVPLTDKIFKEHCYVVVQQDKHFPYLTCRETLLYAAELYHVAPNASASIQIVDEIIDKMGLRICADTRNARLSGGQARRLSIGIALLKQPTLLFLDEPTSGLDAAAAENIMQEIVRVAKDERIIILCTIHQPSTKVYNGFDETMILSRARTAYSGDVNGAVPYFERIGYPLPPQTNPAEHFLDLVNADFSDDAQVDRILDTWEEMRPDANNSSHHHKKGFDGGDEGQSGVIEKKRASIQKEIPIMFRRHVLLIMRDPILYLGRAVVFLVANTIFALVYLKARKYTQDQALNKMWINIWHVGVASNMGAVAVYALNDEFQSILRETKNGMTGPMAYALAKSVLVIPIILIFSVFALGIPSVLIMDFPGSQFGAAMLLWSALLYVFECCAECFSVWLEDPILGMLGYTSYWFGFFLFSGFVIGVDDLVYPFKIFYYVFPFSYYIRSQMYNWLSDATWVPCYPDDNPNDSPICQPNPTGASVLKAVSLSYPVIQAKDTYWQDFGTLIALALVFKVAYVVGVYMRTSRSAMIHPNSDFRASQIEGITASSSKAAEVGPSMSGVAPSSRYLPPGALEIISGEMSEQLQDRVAKFRDYVQVEL